MMDAPVLHSEALMAAGYAAFLMLVGLVIEWVARFTHLGLRRVRTRGFTYHQHLDAWECSEGHLLWLKEKGRSHAWYRADPTRCNRCGIRSRCAGSNEGRELVTPLQDWVRTELGRFQRGMSLTVFGIAALLLGVELLRFRSAGEVILLGAGLGCVALLGARSVKMMFR